MSSKSYKLDILLFFFFFIALGDLGFASPTIVKDEKNIESFEEVDDLNRNNSGVKNSSTSNAAEPSFTHRDEDMIADLKQTTIFASIKYDVEILESSEVKKEDLEIEERYRGPAITLNTDEFTNENIEVNAEDQEEMIAKEALATSHLILSIILVVVAVVTICLYAGLVMWRSHIEQRYGMRELLVTNDNQDYWPQDVISSVVAQHQQQQQQQQQQQ